MVNNNESQCKKTIDNIEKILKNFLCEGFTNEKFRTKRLKNNMILLLSENLSIRGIKKIRKIDICRDIISLSEEKVAQCISMKQDTSICIEDKEIMLKSFLIEGYHKNINKKADISVSISNDKIICNISINGQCKNYTRNSNDEIECINMVRYAILRKVMHCLLKICKKKDDEVTKNMNKDKDKNEK